MIKVTIGLEDKNLLRWFNQMHAALRKAEEGYKKNKKKAANAELAAVLQTLILQINASIVTDSVEKIFKRWEREKRR